ncbi:hypothetical protein Poli38472_000808 [Pythium oligandrum]|uniref:C2H2-type domain-containing protein n=1 Tax=Pythium oligandrum TaxID=41045 RepID=A0A8K1FFP3_PYTOL|nr:hypothetical protein Poli38472_000808 [Pythium oligandrum]|eukprot:TMW60766.1 hypothetical protein Poli38472_000808 [Pythium oligandrum]
MKTPNPERTIVRTRNSAAMAATGVLHLVYPELSDEQRVFIRLDQEEQPLELREFSGKTRRRRRYKKHQGRETVAETKLFKYMVSQLPKAKYVYRVPISDTIRKHLDKAPSLPRRMLRPRKLTQIKRPAPEIAERVEKKLNRSFTVCPCYSCRHLHDVADPTFVCWYHGCGAKFPEFLDYLEHQLDAHGTISPHCRRIHRELHQQEGGVAPYPPISVYIGQQYLHPWVRPVEWTMDQVQVEQKALLKRLVVLRQSRQLPPGRATAIWAWFNIAFNEIQQCGPSQIRVHHRLALEHYESSLLLSAGARGAHDSLADVSIGRNWLTSPEYDNADRMLGLKRVGAPYAGDEASDDELVVLEESGASMSG